MPRDNRIKRIHASLTQFPDIAAPSMWLMALEQRAFWEYWAGMASLKALKALAPRGDGHPVLVLPGLGASDVSTKLLRGFLDGLGYITHPWGLGRNRGFKAESEAMLAQHLKSIYDLHGKKVSLIGQSLGGVFARELARVAPEMTRQVITLGSPFTGHPLASTAIPVYEWLSGERLENQDFSRHAQIRIKPPVPTTSVYSKLDGIVAWQCSIEEGAPDGESIHLRGNTHTGMGSSPAALYLIADRLAQTESDWKPFAPVGLARCFYGTNDHQENPQ
jgi:pimeloyl-ACP methyl ester carboxylesterase